MEAMRPSLVIGLGGTGKLISRMLKEYFGKRYKKEFIDDVTGLPPTIDIFYIDACFGQEREERQLEGLSSQIEGIVVDIPEAKFGVIQSKEYLDQCPEIKEWLVPPLPIKEISNGVGQIRQAGRLAFFEHRKKDKKIESQIKARIKALTGDEMLRKAQRKGINPVRNLDVYIIASLCGGTGSGMLFDVAGIIKAAKPDCKLTLISLFPKIFTENIDMSESVQNMYANTYAALKELDHYMRYNTWEVNYDKERKEKVKIGGQNEQKRLFDYVFFIDIEGKGGKNLQDRLHISPLLTEFFYQFLTSLKKSVEDIRVNIDRNSTAAQWCASFGLSIISFPLEEVLDVCENRLKAEAATALSRGEYSSMDVEQKIKDKNLGLLNTDFNFNDWMIDLCEKETYNLQSSQSIIASAKKNVYANLAREMQSIEHGVKTDLATISQNFEIVLKKIEKGSDKVIEEALITKGPDYAYLLLNNLKLELDPTNLKHEHGVLQNRVSELSKSIPKDLKVIQNKLAKKLDLFGWRKRCTPNINALLRNIKEKAEKELRIGKVNSVIKFLDEIIKDNGLIDKRIELVERLKSNLSQLKSNFNQKEKRAWEKLSFIASAETKLIATYGEVNNFYAQHFEEDVRDVEKDLRKQLFGWLSLNLNDITKGIDDTTKAKSKGKNLESLTIKDIISDQELNKMMSESFEYALPFWQHAAKSPQQDTFLISGFKQNELQNFPSIIKAGDNNIFLSDPIDKRRMVFLTLEYRVPLDSLKAFGLKDWGEDYDDFLNQKKYKWIHLTAAAQGFKDPLGIPVGMEEEDLLQTCRDLGVIFQKGSYYKYNKLSKQKGKEGAKEEVIAEGFDNCIRELKENLTLTKELSKKVIGTLNKMAMNELKTYLNNHNLETYHHDQEDFFNTHSKNYKDAGSGKDVPSHRIPSYIMKEVSKRL